MELTKLDMDLQEIIIQKIHGLGLEEARKKETHIFGNYAESKETGEITQNKKDYICGEGNPIYCTIIGLPPTIDRVLYALGESCIDGGYYISNTGKMFKYTRPAPEVICDWELLNDDGTSATLRDQSVETKEKIYQLIK